DHHLRFVRRHHRLRRHLQFRADLAVRAGARIRKPPGPGLQHRRGFSPAAGRDRYRRPHRPADRLADRSRRRPARRRQLQHRALPRSAGGGPRGLRHGEPGQHHRRHHLRLCGPAPHRPAGHDRRAEDEGMIMLRRILFAVVALLVVLGAAWAFWPRPLAVEMTKIGRQSIDVTVEDEGISRIKDVYTVSAPIARKLLRLNLQAGDAVKAAETILATMEPVAPGLLDARARAVAESNVSAIQAGVAQARAQVEQAQAQLDYAKAQLRRSQSLAGGGVIPEGVYQKSAL